MIFQIFHENCRIAKDVLGLAKDVKDKPKDVLLDEMGITA